MVGTTGADDPLQVIRPANVGYVGRVTDVLLKFGSCFRKKMKSLQRETEEFIKQFDP